MAASLILFAILFYGELFDGLYITSGGILSNFWFATGWIGLLGFLIVGVLRKNSDFKSFTLLLNVMLFVVLLPPTQHLMSKSSGDFLIPQPADYLSDSELATLEDSGRNVEDKPDIFFLIFDRFASDETLLNHYGYDNSSFSDALRRQGFYVADEAHANYTKTAFSLASSLNLTHLDFLSEKIGEGSGDWRPAHSMIRNHQVGKYLVDRNYQYLHIGSAWGPTRKSALAHVNYSGATPNHKTREYLNEFELYILSDTLIDRIVDNRITGRRSNLFRRQYERVKLKFDYLRSIPQDNSPRFIFAHLLLPHSPFVFQADGSFLPPEQLMYTTNDANYINQLKYGADEILKLVNILLRRNPQPVIIIQADEGPFPDRYRLDELTFDWREATDDEFRQKFGIPTAYYFPDRDYAALHPRITPVNTFRILFSKYFGADLPPLADKSYSITSDNDLYSLFEITDKFRTHDGDKLNPQF